MPKIEESKHKEFVPDENGFNNQNSVYPDYHKLNKSQKIAVIFLAFFAFLAVVIWLVQFKQSLSGTSGQDQNNGTPSISSGQNQDRDAVLRNQDTDGDGLNDWDELNIYKTSPYLEDSDSDGFNDREEITSGNDPNCPVGKECQTSEQPTGESTGTVPAADDNTLNTLLNQLNQNAASNAAPGPSGTDNTVESYLKEQMDPATLRQLLLDNGVDKATLDQISDEQLMQSFAEVLTEQ